MPDHQRPAGVLAGHDSHRSIRRCKPKLKQHTSLAKVYRGAIETGLDRGVQGWGSGIIVASDGRQALVLTNKHVLEDARWVVVHHYSRMLQAKTLRIAQDMDVAGLVITSPVGSMQIPIARDVSGTITMMGYDGPTGAFHEHVAIHQTAYQSRQYPYVTHHGESGSPLMNSRGELVGLAWGSDGRSYSMVVGLPAIRAFLATPTCFRFFQRRPISIVQNNGTPGTNLLPCHSGADTARGCNAAVAPDQSQRQ